ncbi:MAG: cyclic nucleotide-binding domain-containing protein [Stenotrophomonas maltophilia]
MDTATAPRSDLLAGLSDAQRDSLLARMRRLQLRKGEHLVRQGEAANHVYYVLRGRFEVLLGGRHLVAEIGAGEPVGEIAFFGGLPRTADVVASRDSEVLELSRDSFEHVSAAQPDFTQSILRILGRRLAATTSAAAAMAPRIADAIGLCPAGSAPSRRSWSNNCCRPCRPVAPPPAPCVHATCPPTSSPTTSSSSRSGWACRNTPATNWCWSPAMAMTSGTAPRCATVTSCCYAAARTWRRPARYR